MVLIVCIDDGYGMSFNKRRQSSDRVITEEILKLSAGKRLWMSPYTALMFPKETNVSADENFLSLADEGEFCFAECIDVNDWISRSESVVVFRWNRRYPSDLKFPYTCLKNEWKLDRTQQLIGNSHNEITMEVFKR